MFAVLTVNNMWKLFCIFNGIYSEKKNYIADTNKTSIENTFYQTSENTGVFYKYLLQYCVWCSVIPILGFLLLKLNANIVKNQIETFVAVNFGMINKNSLTKIDTICCFLFYWIPVAAVFILKVPCDPMSAFRSR